MSCRRSVWAASSLGVLTLMLTLPPVAALADARQPSPPVVAQSGFDGTIDVQPGSVDARVMLESGAAALQAALSDTGPQGRLQVVVPGHFVGSTDVGNGALSYQLEVCGAGVTLALDGARNAGLRFGFRAAAADPARCSTLPSAGQAMTMGVFAPVEAQPAPAPSETGSPAWLMDWLRRLVGFALVGGLLVLFIPAMPGVVATATQTSPWARVGVGLALAFLLPLLGLFGFALLLPLGLWWLGLLILALYPVLLILSLSISGLAVGSFILARLGQGRVPILAAYALGIAIISIASVLPYVGPLVNVAAVIFGLGTLAFAPRTRSPATRAPTANVDATSNDRAELVVSSPVVAA